jgi:hypothetical protein
MVMAVIVSGKECANCEHYIPSKVDRHVGVCEKSRTVISAKSTCTSFTSKVRLKLVPPPEVKDDFDPSHPYQRELDLWDEVDEVVQRISRKLKNLHG